MFRPYSTSLLSLGLCLGLLAATAGGSDTLTSLPSSVPAGWATVVAAACSPDPQRRPPSIEALRAGWRAVKVRQQGPTWPAATVDFVRAASPVASASSAQGAGTTSGRRFASRSASRSASPALTASTSAMRHATASATSSSPSPQSVRISR